MPDYSVVAGDRRQGNRLNLLLRIYNFGWYFARGKLIRRLPRGGYSIAALGTCYNTPMPEMSRPQLLKLLAAIFIVFAALGWAISSVFSKYNSPKTQIRKETVSASPTEVSYEGVITYVDPQLNPGEGISFLLNNSTGEEMILLKSNDQKLEVSEGHFVKVFGTKKKTSTGKEYLLVERIVLKNGSN